MVLIDINKQTTHGGERKLFFILEVQLINVEGIMEIENHHLAKFTVLIVWGKNGQWMLKLVMEVW